LRDEKAHMSAPENLVSHEKMIPVMIDLQVLESHYHQKFQRPAFYKDALDSASLIVFEKYDITKTQFQESFDYYSSDLSVMYLLMEATLDTVTVRLSED
jgi:Domain of unknown function (DUF4296)